MAKTLSQSLNKALPAVTGEGSLNGFDGRREWDRTTDHHHVKVVLYH
jgi:hypothetical protein